MMVESQPVGNFSNGIPGANTIRIEPDPGGKFPGLMLVSKRLLRTDIYRRMQAAAVTAISSGKPFIIEGTEFEVYQLVGGQWVPVRTLDDDLRLLDSRTINPIGIEMVVASPPDLLQAQYPGESSPRSGDGTGATSSPQGEDLSMPSNGPAPKGPKPAASPSPLFLSQPFLSQPTPEAIEKLRKAFEDAHRGTSTREMRILDEAVSFIPSFGLAVAVALAFTVAAVWLSRYF